MTTLTYVDDALPGISRRRKGRAWAYYDPDGNRIADREEIDRLNAVALPPAYVDAWFSPTPDGHLLATGYDEKGRKQYRYHPDFRASQEAAKYARCAGFGRRLPLLRARLDADLSGRRLGYEQVVAAVVRLLDLGALRVGNDRYAKSNKSFGATTLRHRHARVTGKTVTLSYRAKSGKDRTVRVTDRTLASIVRRLEDLPGQRLFQFLGDDGVPHAVRSCDVNDYIREAMGGPFSAKHFRTWHASLCAYHMLADASGKVKLKDMLETVSGALGNTPSIARKSYIHPALIELCKEGQEEWRKTLNLPRTTKYLSRYERGLIRFLEELGEGENEELVLLPMAQAA